MTREQIKECFLEAADAFDSGRIEWVHAQYFGYDIGDMSSLPIAICACAIGGVTAVAIQKGYIDVDEDQTLLEVAENLVSSIDRELQDIDDGVGDDLVHVNDISGKTRQSVVERLKYWAEKIK